MDGLLECWCCILVLVVVDLVFEFQIDIVICLLWFVGLQYVLFGQVVMVCCMLLDFGVVLWVIVVIQLGQVLVIDVVGEFGWVMIGDVLGGYLYCIGVVGIVCDGVVCDIGNLVGMVGLLIYVCYVNLCGFVGVSGDQVNLFVIIGGCVVLFGDLLIGDDDGLVVLMFVQMQCLIEFVEVKMQFEVEWICCLVVFELIVQVFGLQFGIVFILLQFVLQLIYVMVIRL